MRILLTSGASYAPPRGGSTRSNLVWLRHLSAQGHACRVVCPGLDGTVDDDGIAIRRVPDLTLHAHVLGEEIRAFQPDWVLVSSEDVSQILLREADRAASGRIVYLAHTPQFFPFGPESWNCDAAATRIVQRACGAVAIGTHMAGYIERHAGVKAAVIHPPIYRETAVGNAGTLENRSLENSGYAEQSSAGNLVAGLSTSISKPRKFSFASLRAKALIDNNLALMINPCAVKGIGIFLALAARCPDIAFGALPGWGTTKADAAALMQLPNIRLLHNAPDINDILSQARLLLMPSIWYEGFGLIVMEAMLRGLPVISSDSGGLMEAKEGTGFVIPVKPIERYEMVFDENHMPKPVSPQQDIEPWEKALRTLLEDEAAYTTEAARSREAALRFVGELSPDGLEHYLLSRRTPRISLTERELLLRKLRERSSR